MKAASTTETVERLFTTAIPALEAYIRIPNQSPSFDPQIHTNGLQEQAVTVIVDWAMAQGIKGLKHTLVKDEGRTPVLLFEVPAHNSKVEQTVLMYGHLDKQPPMVE